MNIVGRRNWYFLLSLAIILPGIISMAFFGFRLGIDFAGGEQYNLSFRDPVQATAVQKEMDKFNVDGPAGRAQPRADHDQAALPSARHHDPQRPRGEVQRRLHPIEHCRGRPNDRP
jgi:preprotein translocase subunit SecF